MTDDHLPETAAALTPEWLTDALSPRFPGVQVAAIEIVERREVTNSHAWVHIRYHHDAGAPAVAFAKFLPSDPAKKYDTMQWLMWQMGGVGPMFGQAHHFLRAAPSKIEYGIKRYVDEAKRLYGVLDKQLGVHAFAAGADYTIADMAIFPWAARHEWHQVNLADFANVKRWYDTINARPAVTKGMAVPYLN